MRNPHRVRRLVLASTACGLGGVPGTPAGARAARHAAALLLASLPAGDRPLDVRPVADPDGRLMHQQVNARRSRPPTMWGYASQLCATAGWTSLPWLHRIAAPTLVLTGGKDPIVPPINARILGARIPDATVHVMPDAGHLLLMDHAVQCAELISRFLRTTNRRNLRGLHHAPPARPEPFTAPTDRDMLPSERREFVRTHRTCVFGYRRRNDGPAMSVVYYVPTDDDELLVSTMAGRSKALAVSRDPKVSLCVLDERWPFTYLQVYADATVDTDPELVVDVMMAVGERMTGQPLGPEARPVVEAMAEQERASCCAAGRTRRSPRHLGTCTATTKPNGSRHWISGSVGWDAPDPA